MEEFQTQIRGAISQYVKSTITNIPAEHNIPLVQIETKTSLINEEIEYKIKERLEEDFGVEVSAVDISEIEIDKTSSAYKELLSVTKDVTSAITTAKKEADVKNIHDMQVLFSLLTLSLSIAS